MVLIFIAFRSSHYTRPQTKSQIIIVSKGRSERYYNNDYVCQVKAVRRIGCAETIFSVQKIFVALRRYDRTLQIDIAAGTWSK